MGSGAHTLKYREWLQSKDVAPGYTSMRSGSDGREIWRANGAEGAIGFGRKIIATDDRNEDGLRDLVVCADRRVADAIAVICSSTGESIGRYDGVGGAVSLTPDFDGDGHEDFIFDRELPNIVARVEGLVIANGVTGRALGELVYPVAFGLAGMTAGIGDCDGDGVPDFALCEAGHDSQDPLAPAWNRLLPPAPPDDSSEGDHWPRGSGLVVIVSGASLEAVGTVWGCCDEARSVRTYVARWPDVDGDGVAEVLVTCSFAAHVFSWSASNGGEGR